MRCLLMGALAGAVLLGACESSSPIDYTIDPSAPYDGPAIQSSVVNGQHALTVVTPSGGWSVTGHRVVRHSMDNRFFLTLVRPDPELMHTMAFVDFDVNPGVAADEPLAVYVRTVAYGTDPNDTPFVFAKAIAPQR